MKLHHLISIPGSTKVRKRKGIGVGSGNGKTSGRGNKGEKSRSGRGIRHGFESGHVPLYRRLPCRGFNNASFKTSYKVINLCYLDRIKSDLIDKKTLITLGLVRNSKSLVKILGKGKVTRRLTVYADKFSISAKTAIEKSGGLAITYETYKK